MKDPLGIMGSETIFVMESYSGRDVLEFENMAKLKAGITRKTYKLPYPWDGTGGVVYGQYLYYNRLVVVSHVPLANKKVKLFLVKVLLCFFLIWQRALRQS